MRRRTFVLSAATLLAALNSEAFGQTGLEDFRLRGLMDGGFALKSSQLATAKSEHPDVVSFAHSEISEQVQIASMLGAIPGEAPLRADHSRSLARLQATEPGPEFSTMYARDHLRGHEELYTLNQTYLQIGRNGHLRSVAGSSLPLIEQHLSTLTRLVDV
jgi:putative membrane protein